MSACAHPRGAGALQQAQTPLQLVQLHGARLTALRRRAVRHVRAADPEVLLLTSPEVRVRVGVRVRVRVRLELG